MVLAMSDHLADNNPFCSVQSIVHWNASENRYAVDADSLHPSTQRPGLIRIRKTYSDGLNKGKEQSFEELWSKAVSFRQARKILNGGPVTMAGNGR